MNMFAKFDEIPAMTLQVINDGRTDVQTDGRTYKRTDGQHENSIPTHKI